MSPTDNIPLEILQNIFTESCTIKDEPVPACIDTYSLVIVQAVPQLPFQHVPRKVSRQWMQVVDSTPEIWSTIRLFWNYEWNGASLPSETIRQFLRDALRRSRHMPLDIYIREEGWEETASVFLPESLRSSFTNNARKHRFASHST